jgi:hypothetical protein
MIVAVEGSFGSDIVVNVFIAKVYVPGFNNPSVGLFEIVPIDVGWSKAVCKSRAVISSELDLIWDVWEVFISN